jgi:hypothetical protein
MKHAGQVILSCLLFLIFFSAYISRNNEILQKRTLLWNDSLMKRLPKDMDTSLLVYDLHGIALSFRQYIPLLFNNEASIYPDSGMWKLQRFTIGSIDSVQKNDYATARGERLESIKKSDTISSITLKFAVIRHMLSQADHIVVWKGKRQMYIQRKGVILKKFKINLGNNPVGNKIKEGDGRTPEGHYRVDEKFFRSDKYYKSFWISYPDSADKRKARSLGIKPGFNVMIHGTTPARTNAKDWTNGCIALSNSDMDTLFKYVMSGTVIDILK